MNPHMQAERSPWHEAFGHIYVAFWLCKFYLRQKLIGRVAKFVLIVSSVLEFFGPLTHSHVFSLPKGGPIPEIIMGLLFSSGLVVLVHHHKLQNRITRYHILLSSTRVSLEGVNSRRLSGLNRDRHAETKKAVSEILEAFIFSLGYLRNGEGFAGSVLMNDAPGAPFHIYGQDSCSRFEGELQIHQTESVAGKTCTEKVGAIIYMPNTKYPHGVRIAGEESRTGERESFRTARIVTSVFQNLPQDVAYLKSMICVRIPLEQATDRIAVLCFSSKHVDVFGDLEFHAVRLAAGLISLELRNRLW